MGGGCRGARLAVRGEAGGVGRDSAEIEAAVYFCCLEALQNAAKYAGEGASARVHIWEEAGGLLFEVSDDGFGFEPGRQGEGAGLTKLRYLLGAAGGTLRRATDVGTGIHYCGAISVARPRV